MTDKIANELIIASKLMKTNVVSEIASEIGYQPILILNALFAGERSGKFVYVKKKDIIKVSEDVELEHLVITDGLAEAREIIEEFITNENGLEVDMTIDELRSFIPSLPEVHLKVAVFTSKFLTTYELSDPKDKESVYEFVTLKENADKQWGTKQFDESKSKVSKLARKAERKATKQGQ